VNNSQNVTEGLSVGKAVAGSIAANFCAVRTDRLLLVDITQSLSDSRQQSSRWQVC